MIAFPFAPNETTGLRLRLERHGGRGALAAARLLLERDHQAGLAAANELFRRCGPPDPPLDGAYRGDLVAFNIAPGLTWLATQPSRLWLPWQGKRFVAGPGRGDNRFSPGSYPLARLFFPFYRGFDRGGTGHYHAFAFDTTIAAGKEDPDRQVLKIQYDLPENPRLSVRRVLDELVQLDEGLYLGKAHVKWWWGRWQTVAFFLLSGGSQ
jgi:hypothetical protein